MKSKRMNSIGKETFLKSITLYAITIIAAMVGGTLPLALFGIFVRSLLPGWHWFIQTTHVSIMCLMFLLGVPRKWWFTSLIIFLPFFAFWMYPQLQVILEDADLRTVLIGFIPTLVFLLTSYGFGYGVLRNSEKIMKAVYKQNER